MDNPILSVSSLSFAFEKIPVLSDISFSAYTGEVCGLFGPNGSGKSTLFRCCVHLLGTYKGKILVDGEDTGKMEIKKLACKVAYVPQDHQPSFHYAVRDMVLMGRNPHSSGISGFSDVDKKIALMAIRKLGISDLASHSIRELSGGQRQLALIARALAQKTPLMILDEPTSSLDFSNQLMIWEVLREIARSGIAVIACTHDPNHVLWFCDRVIVLNKGRILAKGETKSVLTSDLLSQMYGKKCVIGEYEKTPLVIPQCLVDQKKESIECRKI